MHDLVRDELTSRAECLECEAESNPYIEEREEMAALAKLLRAALQGDNVSASAEVILDQLDALHDDRASRRALNLYAHELGVLEVYPRDRVSAGLVVFSDSPKTCMIGGVEYIAHA